MNFSIFKTGFFGWDNIKQIFKDLYETWSAKDSKLSSKRIERTAFTGTVLILTIACFIYLWLNHILTAMDTIMLTTPLLIAAGYNMNQTQKEKKEIKEDGQG